MTEHKVVPSEDLERTAIKAESPLPDLCLAHIKSFPKRLGDTAEPE